MVKRAMCAPWWLVFHPTVRVILGNPVSFQFIKDYNDTIRAQGSDTEDNFGLKILLAYYEYYNNFSGF